MQSQQVLTSVVEAVKAAAKWSNVAQLCEDDEGGDGQCHSGSEGGPSQSLEFWVKGAEYVRTCVRE